MIFFRKINFFKILLNSFWHNQKAFSSFYIVIIMNAIVMMTLLSFSTTSITSIHNGNQIVNAKTAAALANICAELALQEIREDSMFLGTEEFNLDLGDCIYSVLDLGGERREIRSFSEIDHSVQKVKVVIEAINPKISISFWKEVADF